MQRTKVHLVCGGRFHDIDFARLELLKLLAEQEHFRVSVAPDYRDVDQIRDADALITYTCEVMPTDEQQDALADYLNAGKRWFALHGTNSRLKYIKGKGWDAPREAPRFMDMLGSQFLAHPPIQPYTVRPCVSDDPLVEGVTPFEADDELYLCEFHGERRDLMVTEYSGKAEGFIHDDWSEYGTVPVMYLHPWGEGEVLYLNLGHARGKYDMLPIMEEYPHIERGSWKQPEFYELLRRGMRWMVGEIH